MDGQALGEPIGGVGGDVLPFVGDGGGAVGELIEGSGVVVLGTDMLGEAGGAWVLDGVEDAAANAERLGGLGDHACQLAAAEDGEGVGRFRHLATG